MVLLSCISAPELTLSIKGMSSMDLKTWAKIFFICFVIFLVGSNDETNQQMNWQKFNGFIWVFHLKLSEESPCEGFIMTPLLNKCIMHLKLSAGVRFCEVFFVGGGGVMLSALEGMGEIWKGGGADMEVVQICCHCFFLIGEAVFFIGYHWATLLVGNIIESKVEIKYLPVIWNQIWHYWCWFSGLKWMWMCHQWCFNCYDLILDSNLLSVVLVLLLQIDKDDEGSRSYGSEDMAGVISVLTSNRGQQDGKNYKTLLIVLLHQRCWDGRERGCGESLLLMV